MTAAVFEKHVTEHQSFGRIHGAAMSRKMDDGDGG